MTLRLLFFPLMLVFGMPGADASEDAANIADAVRTPIVINVVATSPLRGPGLDTDKLPVTVQSITAKDFSRLDSPSVVETLVQRVPGMSTSDPQGNDFTRDVRFRGFAASPLQGTPQGLAVYQNGVRLNEAFGDTMNWDLIPGIAIARSDVWSSNPVFGLNALGGAVSLQMKTGFDAPGGEAAIRAGSAGLGDGSLQYGWRREDVAAYLAADGLSESGWREHSPSRLARVYGDVGWRGDGAELHLAGSAASNRFGVVGPTPVQMLAQNYRSVYTWPQSTTNDMQMLALNGSKTLSDGWSMQGNAYARHFRQSHVDGNGGDFEQCSARSSYPGALCLEDDGFPPPPGGKTPAFRDQFVIVNAHAVPIVFASSETPYGTVDGTSSDATTLGGALQATSDSALGGHPNHFLIGASADAGRVKFSAASTLGYVYPDLFVGNSDLMPGSGEIIHTLGNIGVAPVQVQSSTRYYGIYATDTIDINAQLALTAGARFNDARVSLKDQLGTSPALDGTHRFSRVNPNVGLAYKPADAFIIFAGYSEANRVPTPLELGCSDAQKPCLLEGFLVADPPLQQVVSKTIELGARGHGDAAGAHTQWLVSIFHSDVDNDIINLASAIQGRGYFQNAPATSRQGVDVGMQYSAARWSGYLNYNYLAATYRFAGELSSPNNPRSDDGKIRVALGDHIPGLPRQQVKAGVDYVVASALTVGGDVAFVDRQFYVGDDSNQNAMLPSYTVTSIHATYALASGVDLTGTIDNLFDRRYALYGTYFAAGEVTAGEAQSLTDPRTQSPGRGIAFRAGVRVRF